MALIHRLVAIPVAYTTVASISIWVTDWDSMSLYAPNLACGIMDTNIPLPIKTDNTSTRPRNRNEKN
jgi:hypothetical protein